MVEYYKVVILRVTAFETIVEDERHFPTKEQAYAFATDHSDLTPLVIQMKDNAVRILTA